MPRADVHADLSGEEFAKVWLDIPLWLRATTYVLTPAVGIWLRWFGSQAMLARKLPLDDLPGREEILNLSPETVALNQAILHPRDVRLVERLGEQLDDPGLAVRRIAIVYGASHMRAVLRELTGRRGYRVERGDWLTAFACRAVPGQSPRFVQRSNVTDWHFVNTHPTFSRRP